MVTRELKVGDLVRRKTGKGKHGSIKEGDTFTIVCFDNFRQAGDGVSEGADPKRGYMHSLDSIELVEPTITNTYPIW